MPVLAERAPAPSRARTRWHDLRPRILSALILGPLGLAAIVLGGPVFAAVVVVLAVLMAGEWAAMCGLDPWRWPGLGVALAVAPGVASAGFGPAALAPWLLAAGAGAALLAGVARRGSLAGVARRASLAAGVAYIGTGSACLAWLRADPASGLANTLFLVLLVWASDSGAFVVGRTIGGPRLAPLVSPGKTWSGAVGGLFAAMAAGAAVARAFGHGPIWPAAFAAGGLGLAAQAGDLLESAAKRHFGVKDSGRLIPGHGGLLDRLDAMLAAGPVACVLALAMGEGVALWR